MTNSMLFQREIKIDAPLDFVWPLVATEEGLRQWWGNTIMLEPKEGGRCEEWRMDRHGTSHWQGVVTLYAPPHQLVMTLRPEPVRTDAPQLTTIAITLHAQGDATTVHVSQRAFGPAPAIGKEIDTTPEPSRPHGVPLAQLVRPAPGTVPMPARTLSPGQLDPAYRLLSRTQMDALRATWEARITALHDLTTPGPQSNRTE